MPGPRLVLVLAALAFVFLFTMMAGLALSILPYVDGAATWLAVAAWMAAVVYVAGLAAAVLALCRSIGGARRARGARIGG